MSSTNARVARRPNGEGSLRRKPDGGWYVRISVRDPITGRPMRREIYGGKTREAADAKRIALLADRLSHVPYHENTVTLGDWLARWVETLRLREGSITRYRYSVRAWQGDSVASRRIASLTPSDLRAATARLGEQYAPSTLRLHFTVLRRALHDAEHEGVVRRNVARLTDAPSVPRRAMRLPSADELARLGPVIHADERRALWLLAIHMGMRQGEILALTWGDLSPGCDEIWVHATMHRDRTTGDTKSDRSRRLLDHVHPDVIAALREHRQALVDAGVVPHPGRYVFTQADGRPYSGGTLRWWWLQLCKRAGVRAIRFHDLRHLAATGILAAGTDLVTASRLLGHASTGITADLYAHPDYSGVRWAPSLPTARDGG